MGDEVKLSMAIPTDSDGFIRRACPTCEREFKWFAAPEGSTDNVEPPDGGYFCPYCGVQAPPDSWWTDAQVALMHNTVAREAMGPALRDFGRSLESIGRNSGGLVKASFEYRDPEKMDPLTEEDDLRRVDFGCHPSEPVKVLDDWKDPVSCLICGTRVG